MASAILIHPAVWPQWTWAENWGGGLRPLPFGGRGAGSLSNIMWTGPRPTCMPSFIFRHRLATIHQRYRQYRQDRTDRQRSDSIGRTVLQTVAQKSAVFYQYCAVSKTVQDRNMITMEGYWELLCIVLNGVVSSDLE